GPRRAAASVNVGVEIGPCAFCGSTSATTLWATSSRSRTRFLYTAGQVALECGGAKREECRRRSPFAALHPAGTPLRAAAARTRCEPSGGCPTRRSDQTLREWP